jgi:hypothetical protein
MWVESKGDRIVGIKTEGEGQTRETRDRQGGRRTDQRDKGSTQEKDRFIRLTSRTDRSQGGSRFLERTGEGRTKDTRDRRR